MKTQSFTSIKPEVEDLTDINIVIIRYSLSLFLDKRHNDNKIITRKHTFLIQLQINCENR